jgi:uncharacterized membrane protein YdcZ (DUF606 family)
VLLALVVGLLTPLKAGLLARRGLAETITLIVVGLLAAGMGLVLSSPPVLAERAVGLERMMGAAVLIAFILLWFWVRAFARQPTAKTAD